MLSVFVFFFQAEDGIRDWSVTGVQTCALPICFSGPASRCIFKPDRKSSSPGIRLGVSASKPSTSSEQNASTKSSTISQPPSESTARIGRTPHSLKPMSNHLARLSPDALLSESCGVLVSGGERHDEYLPARILVNSKTTSCC